MDYSDNGSTTGAVNFPQVLLPTRSSGIRFIQVHRNEPGGLGRLNDVFTQYGNNVAAQYCQTDSEIGYVVVDVEGTVQDAPGMLREIRNLPGTICARLCLSKSTSRTFLISTRASSVWLPPSPIDHAQMSSSSVPHGEVRALQAALQYNAQGKRSR